MVDKKEVRKKLKRANSRLSYMREKGLGDLSVIPLALREHAKITGEKSNTFKMGRNPSLKKLEQLDRQLDKFLHSKWTSAKGRKEIYDKRLSTFADKGIDRDVALKLFDVFSTDAYHKAVERGLLDSSQMIELIKHSDAKSTDFERAIQEELQKANTSYDLADAFENIQEKL